MGGHAPSEGALVYLMSCVSDEDIWKQTKVWQEIKAVLEKSKANTEKPLATDQRKFYRRTFLFSVKTAAEVVKDECAPFASSEL